MTVRVSSPMKRYICCLMLVFFSACVQEEGTPILAEDIPTEEEIGVEEALSKFAKEMLDAVNKLRKKGCVCGEENMPPVHPLSWDPKLEIAARRHAKDMKKNNFLEHKGSDGSTLSERVSEAGYRWRRVGENIASGYPGITAVLEGWKASAGHCRNMMNAEFKDLGAAREGDYWVQNFAR